MSTLVKVRGEPAALQATSHDRIPKRYLQLYGRDFLGSFAQEPDPTNPAELLPIQIEW
jgi:hypothetical protein